MRSGRLPRAKTPALVGWAVLAFLYLPIVVLAIFSFNAGRYTSRWEGFSLDWYRTLFSGGDRQARSLAAPLEISLRLAVCAAGVAVVLSTWTALGLRGARRGLAIPLGALWALPVQAAEKLIVSTWGGSWNTDLH